MLGTRQLCPHLIRIRDGIKLHHLDSDKLGHGRDQTIFIQDTTIERSIGRKGIHKMIGTHIILSHS